MNIQLPQNLDQFIQNLIADGRFANESEVLTEGLRLLQAREQLHRDVRAGFDQLDRGEGIAAEEVYDRLNKQIAEIENKNNGGKRKCGA